MNINTLRAHGSCYPLLQNREINKVVCYRQRQALCSRTVNFIYCNQLHLGKRAGESRQSCWISAITQQIIQLSCCNPRHCEVWTLSPEAEMHPIFGVVEPINNQSATQSHGCWSQQEQLSLLQPLTRGTQKRTVLDSRDGPFASYDFLKIHES